jgi:hypothetical protein
MIDKRLLVDSAVVARVAGLDDWGKVIYVDQVIELATVKFDRSSSLSGEKNERERTSAGVLFVYPEATPVIVDDTWLNAKVTIDGASYQITKYLSNKLPFRNKIFSYEIEVI